MKEPTKKKRHDIYKLMLEKALKEYKDEKTFFLCHLLEDVIEEKEFPFSKQLFFYKELKDQKPKKNSSIAWWNKGNTKGNIYLKRINVLKKCIELTETKK